MIDRLTIRRPDDWHVHLRDGPVLAAVVGYTARQFARAIVMPNLSPPITRAAEAAKSAEELDRRQHYGNSQEYRAYHAGLHRGVRLWCGESREYLGWRQLEDLGLISRGNWA